MSGEEAVVKLTLKREIRWRAVFVFNDCMTYIRVRYEQNAWYNANEAKSATGEGLGGGNFFMAHGLLAAINFLSKVHLWLTKPERFNIADDKQAVKAALKLIKQKGTFTTEEAFTKVKETATKGRTEWKEPREGDCNEADAFADLVMAMQSEVDLGLETSDQARKVWKHFRNDLAHMAAPGKTIKTTRGTSADMQAVEQAIKAHGKAFQREDGEWLLFVDRLAFDICDICNWMFKRIDNADGERVKEAINWLTQGKSPFKLSATTTSTTFEMHLTEATSGENTEQ